MFRVIEIEELARHKRTLLIESDKNRHDLLNDFNSLQQSTQWVQKVYRFVKGGYPYVFLASPILAILGKKKGIGKTLNNISA